MKSNVLTNLIVVLLSVGTSFLLYSSLDPMARGVIILSMLYPQLVNGLLYAGLERLIFARKIIIELRYIFLLMGSLVIIVLFLAGVLRPEIFSQEAFWIMIIALPFQFAYSYKTLDLFLTGNQLALNMSKLLYQSFLTIGTIICVLNTILTPVIYCLLHLMAVFLGMMYVMSSQHNQLYEYKSGDINFGLISRDFIFGLALSNMGYLPGLYASTALSLSDISKVNLVQNIAKLPSFLSSAFGQTLLVGVLASENFKKVFYIKLFALTSLLSIALFTAYIFYIEDKFFMAYKQNILTIGIIFIYSFFQMLSDVYVSKSKGVAVKSTRKSWIAVYYFSFIFLMIFIDSANINKYIFLVLLCELARIGLVIIHEKKHS